MPEGKAPNGSPAPLDCDTEELPEGGFGWFLIRDLAHELNYTRISGKNLLSFRISVGAP
jgi:serine/threonine-protein kinase RsbW